MGANYKYKYKYEDKYNQQISLRKNIEYSVKLEADEDLVTLSGLYEQLKQHNFALNYAR